MRRHDREFTMNAVTMPCFGETSGSGGGNVYVNPADFEEEIRCFEAADKKHPPPQGAIVCIGSSSMRGWHETIHEDLAPLTIVPRGFGGSNMNDAFYYADRIVTPCKPRAVVIYEGDNDVAQGIAPRKTAETFQAFVEKVHAELPGCRIYFLAIKPSIQRWHLWSKMTEVNGLIAAKCREDARLTFVDVASGMLDDEGKPRAEMFEADNLHMKRSGYVSWRDALLPILMKSELSYEKQNPDAFDKPNAGDGK